MKSLELTFGFHEGELRCILFEGLTSGSGSLLMAMCNTHTRMRIETELFLHIAPSSHASHSITCAIIKGLQ